jgi:DNA polymerase-3 subunit gamma/tau
VRDLLVVRIDPTRLADPDIAAEGERNRLQALAALFSREDLLRSFDLLSRAEFEIRGSSQPRHHFEMSLVKWIHLRKMTELTDLLDAAKGLKAVDSPAPSRGAAAAAPASPRAARPVPSAPAAPAVPPAAARAAVSAPAPTGAGSPSEIKSALLSAIRETNKNFFGLVAQQAIDIAIEGNTIVFTFSTAHRSSRLELERRRPWLEELARTAAGRPMSVAAREVAPPPASPEASAAAGRQQELRDKAKANPGVQAILEVFGGEVEDVEEIN